MLIQKFQEILKKKSFSEIFLNLWISICLRILLVYSTVVTYAVNLITVEYFEIILTLV